MNASIDLPQEKPILYQSPELESRIQEILHTTGERHYFHLLRYQHWPEYRMPIYYFICGRGRFEVQIERHTSYWAFIVKSNKQFAVTPFVELSARKHAYSELYRKPLIDYCYIETHCLEVHLDDEAELLEFIRKSLPLMKVDLPT